MVSFLRRLLGGGVSGADVAGTLPIPDGPAKSVQTVIVGSRQGHVQVLLPGDGPDGRRANAPGMIDLQRLGPAHLRPGDSSLPVPVDLHRVAELTISLAGDLEHRDALGNRGRLHAPAARLVSGGAGIRSEVGLHRDHVREGGAAEVITLRWLQAAAVTPTVRLSEHTPVVGQGRCRVRVIMGPSEGAWVIGGDGTTVLHAEVPSGAGLHLPVPERHRSLLVVLEGTVLVGDTSAGDETGLTQLTAGRSALLGDEGLRCGMATKLQADPAQVLLVTMPETVPADAMRTELLVHETPEQLVEIQRRQVEGAFGRLPRS